uniref:Uncharacterized protein n=1 Tax=Amphimedon queenslandica TaxID=400682 RepID=A0A1X7TIW4_AMPQE
MNMMNCLPVTSLLSEIGKRQYMASMRTCMC